MIFLFLCLKKGILFFPETFNSVTQMLDQLKLLQLKKKDGNDPVIALHLGVGRKNLIRNWILQNVRDEKGAEGAEGENRVGQSLCFLISSVPSGGPVLNSVIDLWGFCWGV